MSCWNSSPTIRAPSGLASKSGCWPTGWPPRLPTSPPAGWRARRFSSTATATTKRSSAARQARSLCSARLAPTVEPIQAGCCGMAGPFGFEADKFEVSKAIANDGLLPAVEVRRANDDHRRRRLQLPRADRPARRRARQCTLPRFSPAQREAGITVPCEPCPQSRTW